MSKRVSSAPYRFAEQNKSVSQYHQKCGSATARSRGVITHGNVTEPEPFDQFQKKSVVVQDEIWKNSCWKEGKRGEKWKETWGFLTEFDQKGNPREPKQVDISHETTIFSDHVPNTSNGHYGQKLKTANTSYIKQLEQSNNFKLQKRDSEVLYY